MSLRLQGKRAVVTGGGSGIGRGAALKLAAEGAQVGVLDVNLDAAQQVVDKIQSADGSAGPSQASRHPCVSLVWSSGNQPPTR